MIGDTAQKRGGQTECGPVSLGKPVPSFPFPLASSLLPDRHVALEHAPWDRMSEYNQEAPARAHTSFLSADNTSP